jgi:hypothetical protein
MLFGGSNLSLFRQTRKINTLWQSAVFLTLENGVCLETTLLRRMNKTRCFLLEFMTCYCFMNVGICYVTNCRSGRCLIPSNKMCLLFKKTKEERNFHGSPKFLFSGSRDFFSERVSELNTNLYRMTNSKLHCVFLNNGNVTWRRCNWGHVPEM